MPDEKFKLPLCSYDELIKFIKAYSHLTKPTELAEISKLTGVAVPNISKNIGFLTATGILKGGKMKSATESGRQLGQALEHGMADEILKSWRHIIEENEFLTKLLTAVRIRNGMDPQTLEAHIAYSAGQPKKPQFMTGARTVIDILRAAELIVEFDGKLLLKKDIAEETHADTLSMKTPEEVVDLATTQTHRSSSSLPIESCKGVQINIQININCTPDDLAGLGASIKDMIHEIGSSEDNNGDE